MDHVTVYRWVQCYAPEINRRMRQRLKMSGASFRIDRRWRVMHCFRSFHAAERTLEGIESLRMLRKGQVKRLDGRDAVGRAKFVAGLFGAVA